MFFTDFFKYIIFDLISFLFKFAENITKVLKRNEELTI